jgi:hypothetical protein
MLQVWTWAPSRVSFRQSETREAEHADAVLGCQLRVVRMRNSARLAAQGQSADLRRHGGRYYTGLKTHATPAPAPGQTRRAC